jgi:uncharacterized protein (DUF2267 family)
LVDAVAHVALAHPVQRKSTKMNEERLIEQVKHRGGLDTENQAAAALKSTLRALGEGLSEPDREAIARALPERLRAVLRTGKHRGAFDIAEFFDRVRRREGVKRGFGREHAQVVCTVLGESLPEEALTVLERALPERLFDLFRRSPSEPEPPGRRIAPSARHHTLATGKPGPLRPLSEAAPPGAQSHSVVGEENPHENIKLSSAAGMSQEREDESLARAHPDASRRIGRASD